MIKKYSLKFWLLFWGIAIIFLTGWYFFWETRNQGIQSINSVINFLPGNEESKSEWKALAYFAEYLLKQDDQEKVFLVLFQNNMEIRPGGGFIGSFGILKVKNGRLVDIQTHDLSNFDARIPDTFEPPYPMKETLGINSWKLRDSNYSPDYPTNAKQAEDFYHLGDGQENFDGVIAITANVLSSLLEVTGPVAVEGYPGEYDSENALISLEYQVEKGYYGQGIEKGERKSVMNPLSKAILEKISDLDTSQKLELAKVIRRDLDRKDIQLYFKDQELQKKVADANWGGIIDENWSGDYLATFDANLGAFKSDYYVRRSVDYSVDLTKEKPEAILKITYNHTAKEKDWMTRDYLSYLRIYVPEGSWLTENSVAPNPRFGDEVGKKYFGFIIKVPIGQEKTFEFRYTLPEEIKDNYDLKIQKQPGINDIPYKVTTVNIGGTEEVHEFKLNSDVILSEME